MLPCDDDGRHHQVGRALPPAMPPPEVFHHARARGVEHDVLELGKHLLRVKQSLVREGSFGRRGLQGKVTPPTEHLGNHNRKEGDLGPRHTQQI
jgi:hypothetical protein